MPFTLLAVLLASMLLGGCRASSPVTFFEWGVKDTFTDKSVKEIERHSQPLPSQRLPLSQFRWPVDGKIVGIFDLTRIPRNAGLDIAVTAGAPIRASASGRVVYQGSELASYGKLLLIEHREEYVSVYSSADRYVVKKGDSVEVGQIIGYCSSSRAGQNIFHFEIRRSSKPLNPETVLPKRGKYNSF
jgi:lipoprotein NlpD